MSVKIITKHETGGTGDEPLSTDLEKGELGVNTVDGKLWVGDGASKKLLTPSGGLVDGLADGNTLRWEDSASEWQATSALVVDDAGNVTATGDLTAASFIGDGSQLTNVPGATQWDDVTGGINYADGSVGIGTENPSTKLEVAKLGSDANVARFYTDQAQARLVLDSSGSSNYQNFYGAEGDNLVLGTGNAERMRIDSGGAVGIGTNNPDLLLTVAGEIASDRSNGGRLNLRRESVPGANGGLGNIRCYGQNSSGDYIEGANLNMQADGAWSDTSTPTRIVLSTCPVGSNVIQERMRIDNSGNVQISTGNLELSNGGGWYQSDASWVRSLNDKAVYNANTTANAFTTPGDFTAGYSDMRLKTHLGTIPDALDKVCSLEGFYYERNDVAQSLGYQGGERRVGLSAQDVQAVLPEVVKDAPINIDNGTDYLTIDYERVVPLLVESIKDLRAEIDELKRNQK